MKTFILILVTFLALNISSFPQWVQQNSGTSERFLTCYFLNENIGWSAGDEGTIVKTTDSGESWFSQSVATQDIIHSIFFIDSLNGWIALYEFIPARHGSVMHTTNGGETWITQLQVDLVTLHDVFFTDTNNGYTVGSSGTLYKTTNSGQNWNYVSPISGYWLYSAFFHNQDFGWVCGGLEGYLLRTTNAGQTWSNISIPVIPRMMAIFFYDDNFGWACGASGNIIRTINGGLDWTATNSGINKELRDIFFINQYEGWAVSLGGKIIHSIDGGVEWELQNSGTTSNLFGVSFADESLGWVAGDNGTILKTLNGGVPVELVSFTAELLNNLVNLSWITATETNNFGFEIERKIFNDWEKIAFVEGNGTTTNQQYYFYSDDIATLQEVRKMFYRLKQIDYDGTFEYSNEVEVFLNPFFYSLLQNFPNPFNPSTTISFSLPEKKWVKLVIYDINGTLVEILVNKQMDPGNYSVKFNSTGLASGIYYYRLQTSNFIVTKKMILLK
jgi:photosystem II stability/assembly factor-like uncharacterized protein